MLATATSGEPSPLKSPMLTNPALVPVGKSTLGAKPRIPAVGFEGGFCEGEFGLCGGWGDG